MRLLRTNVQLKRDFLYLLMVPLKVNVQLRIDFHYPLMGLLITSVQPKRNFHYPLIGSLVINAKLFLQGLVDFGTLRSIILQIPCLLIFSATIQRHRDRSCGGF